MKYILTTLNDIFTAVVCLFGNGLTLYVFHYFYYGYEFCKDVAVAIGLMERTHTKEQSWVHDIPYVLVQLLKMLHFVVNVLYVQKCNGYFGYVSVNKKNAKNTFLKFIELVVILAFI